ncbi:MAG: FAD-dependent oxidoreductase [Planctomycetota bacterium]
MSSFSSTEPKPDIKVDVLIVGGGVAGLWTLAELRARGVNAILVENTALGSGQTIWSQGILHSGLKYALDGISNTASAGIGDSPARWRRCLAGESKPDLGAVSVRSDRHYLWRNDSIVSRLGMVGARLAMRTPPAPVPFDQRPPALRDVKGEVLSVDEQVIDPVSLLRSLASLHQDRIGHAQVVGIDAGKAGVDVGIQSQHGDQMIRADHLALTAGNGNAALRELAGLDPKSQQVRPLRMIMVRSPELTPLAAHCVQGKSTRATITSPVDSEGRVIWQLGGEIAERSIDMTDEQAIDHAHQEMTEILPHINWSQAEWGTYDAPRAEGRTKSGGRPGAEVILQEGRIFTAWPTKLVLAPQVGARIAELLPPLQVSEEFCDQLLMPPIARPPWDKQEAWSVLTPQASAE